MTPEEKSEELIGSFNSNDRQDIAAIKYAAKALVEVVEQSCPDGRRKAIAMTHIEQATMIAVKSLFE